MPLRRWKCYKCSNILTSLQLKAPICCEESTELLLSAPGLKMMEPRDHFKGKSVIKDQYKLLKERAKDHTRKTEYEGWVAEEKDFKISQSKGWLNEKGRIKTKIETK